MRVLDTALDTSSPRRFEIWRAAHEQLALLEPHRPMMQLAFVKSGLIHWKELNAADRKSVLDAAEPMLHDEQFFNRTAETILRVTGDFALLRRANPGTASALRALEQAAVANGKFEEYRAYREHHPQPSAPATWRNETPGQWIGLCGGDICDRAHEIVLTEGGPFALRFAVVQSDQVPPYVEVSVDGALIAEGAVAPSLDVRTTLTRGAHRIDVRLVNAMTHTSLRRRIRIE